jgi:protoporphyrinogen IX oxidase
MALFWSSAYPWIKAFHVISVIAWMAGMLYLPRLFVYHCQVPVGSPQSELFKVMERRLLRRIVNPAMIATWVFGLLLAWQGGFFAAPWLHAKLTLVILMSAMHGYYAGAVRRFAQDRNTLSERTWRVLNEVPAVLVVGIVLLVILKPF